MARPFRLQTVARLRESRRDEARAQLADALQAAEMLREKQADLDGRFVDLLEQRRAAAATADTHWLLNAGRYELVLKADERTLAENRETIEREIERRRQVLAEAEREVRVMEILREKAEREQRAIANRREARALDEHGSRRAFEKDHPSPLT